MYNRQNNQSVNMLETHDGDQPKKQLATARGGSGGKRRTAVGAGEGGGEDDHFLWPYEQYEQPPIPQFETTGAIICEQDDQLRTGFQCIFRPVVPVVAEAKNTDHAWELILRYNPILVICSSGPGVFELCRRVRDERFDRRIGVLVMTDTFGGTRYYNRLLASGARGVVLKSSSEDELRDAARIVMYGGLYCDSQLTVLLARQQATIINGVNLSPVEINVLVRLSLDDDEIKRELNISQEILMSVLDRAFQALRVNTRAEAQSEVTKLGLIQLPRLVKIDRSTGETIEDRQARMNCQRAIANSLVSHG